jgi:hypothetical protein
MVLDLSEVDARIPIMRRELKDDACTNVDGYFRLGHKDFTKAKTLTEKLVYIYAMKFDVSPLLFLWLSLIVVPLLQGNNNATPIRNRPYQGELLVLMISNQLFHSSRAVGVKFASRFVEIAKNKSKRPEIPIPFLALVATAVVCLSLLCEYAAHLFIGLFCSFMEVAWFSREVQLLWKPIQRSLQLPCQVPRTAEARRTWKVPLYDGRHLRGCTVSVLSSRCSLLTRHLAYSKLKHNGATGDHIELNAFELLDLEGMEED